MVKPKFRLFAGPNASGKTHVFKKFKRKKYIHTEFYVNADRYEEQMKKTRKFSFNAYRVKVTDEDFKQHISQSGLFQTKIKNRSFIDQFTLSWPWLPFCGKMFRSFSGEELGLLCEEINAKKRIAFEHESVATFKSELVEFIVAHPNKFSEVEMIAGKKKYRMNDILSLPIVFNEFERIRSNNRQTWPNRARSVRCILVG